MFNRPVFSAGSLLSPIGENSIFDEIKPVGAHERWNRVCNIKPQANSKGKELRPRFEGAVRELLGRVPFLKVASSGKESFLSEPGSPGVNGLVQISAGTRNGTLVVEENSVGSPREVRAAVFRLKCRLAAVPPAARSLMGS